MKNLFLIIIFALISNHLFSQNESVRLEAIEIQLNELADSSITDLNQILEFSVVNTSVQELLRGVAKNHHLNINIAPDINIRITNNFTNVSVKNLLIFLCKEYKLDLEIMHNIITIRNLAEKPKEVTKPKLSLINYNSGTNEIYIDSKGDTLSHLIRDIILITGKNLVLAPDVEDKKIYGLINNIKFKTAIEKLAFANNLLVSYNEEDDFYTIEKITIENKSDSKQRTSSSKSGNSSRRNLLEDETPENLLINLNPDSTLSIEAINAPVEAIINKSAKACGLNYIYLNPPSGTFTLLVNKISFDKLIELLLDQSTFAYTKSDGIYIFGEGKTEGFRESKVLRFNYRTIWDISKAIPNNLKADIEIIPFDELNAIILSGSSKKVKLLENFIRQLDQPIPNILIDVIVIDVQKTASIQTGISAFLSDSVISSGGQLFPGLDATVGSDAINLSLDMFSQFSTVNLGRVKSNFYLSLKALEQSGNIKINSTPKLATLNGHEATLTIGESEYYLEKTQNVTGGVNPIITTSPRYGKVDANLTIKIKPMVAGDNSVTLDIEAEFSDFVPPKVEDAPPGNSTRKFVSQIRVDNEEVILLGGLEESGKEQTGSGFPLLSRIPILKWIFSSVNKTNRDNKLLVLIKPQIDY